MTYDQPPHHVNLSHNLPPQGVRTTEVLFFALQSMLQFLSGRHHGSVRRGKWTSQADDRTEDRERGGQPQSGGRAKQNVIEVKERKEEAKKSKWDVALIDTNQMYRVEQKKGS